MTFDNIAIPLLAFLLVLNSVYFSIKNGSLKPQNRNELIIGLVLMGFSIWYEMDKSNEIKTLQTSNNTLDTNINLLLSQRRVDSINNESSQQNIGMKIDSVKTAISDSIKIGTQNTITVLQNTIRDQAIKIDSLNKLHGEKELSNKEKKDVLNKILTFTNNAPPQNVPIFLYTYMGANSGKFPSQITKFLKSKGYGVFSGGIKMTVTGQPLVEGYEVKGFNKNEIHILIGSFK